MSNVKLLLLALLVVGVPTAIVSGLIVLAEFIDPIALVLTGFFIALVGIAWLVLAAIYGEEG